MLQEIFRSYAKNLSFLYALQKYCYHLLNYNMKHFLVQSLSLSGDVLKLFEAGTTGLPSGFMWDPCSSWQEAFSTFCNAYVN